MHKTEKRYYISIVFKNEILRCQQDKVGNPIMANEISSDRGTDSPVWITVNRERKNLTLNYKNCHQGQRDYTLTYSVDNEAELYSNPYPILFVRLAATYRYRLGA